MDDTTKTNDEGLLNTKKTHRHSTKKSSHNTATLNEGLSNIKKKTKKGRPRKYSSNYPKLDTIKRIKQSQDLIKKGFNVCYALEEFIRAAQNNPL